MSNDNYALQLAQTFHEHFAMHLPEVVWHYTSFETFEKIVKSNEIWSTHVSCLNDLSEVTFAANLIRGVLDAYIKDDGLAIRDRQLLEIARTSLLESNSDSSWFVACLSEAEDDLAQWARYGEQSKGVAIGFHSRELIRFFSGSAEDRPMFCKVCYDAQKTLEFGSKLIALTLSNFHGQDTGVDDIVTASKQFFENWGPHVDAFSIVPKHPGFVSEREWRIARQVLNPNAEPSLCVSEGRKFLRLQRGKHSDSKHTLLPIAHVRVGPLGAANKVNIVQSLLFEAGHKDVRVTKSTIPLSGG